MEKNNNNNRFETDKEEIMNRVNQTFDRISQDVKDMITGTNESQEENHYS